MGAILGVVLAVALALVIIGLPWLLIWLVAGGIEARHAASLAEREQELGTIAVSSLRRAPADAPYALVGLATGSVVIGINAIRMVMTALRMLVGGECAAASAVMRQGRREALVRLRREARRMGATHVINVRFETSSIGSRQGNNNGASMEFLAYGTAIRRR